MNTKIPSSFKAIREAEHLLWRVPFVVHKYLISVCSGHDKGASCHCRKIHKSINCRRIRGKWGMEQESASRLPLYHLFPHSFCPLPPQTQCIIPNGFLKVNRFDRVYQESVSTDAQIRLLDSLEVQIFSYSSLLARLSMTYTIVIIIIIIIIAVIVVLVIV